MLGRLPTVPHLTSGALPKIRTSGRIGRARFSHSGMQSVFGLVGIAAPKVAGTWQAWLTAMFLHGL